MGNDQVLYTVAGGAALLVGLLASLLFFSYQRKQGDSSYNKQFEELIQSELEEEGGSTKVTLAVRWNRYWATRFGGMGWAKYSGEGSNTAGRDVLLAAGLAAVVASVLLRNPLAGVAIAALLTYVAGALMKMKADKDQDVLNAQLPGFLFALKSNVQANETPERAILKVVDNMPSPLYEDLLIVKNRILANSTFKEALEELSTKTASRDLKFLCACMIQAASTGTNLEAQITIIQKVLEDRRKVSDELSKAIRSATPAIWVASVVIPAVFVATLFLDPSSASFWFHEPLSWVALGVVVALYGGGVWLSKKLVDSIKNL